MLNQQVEWLGTKAKAQRWRLTAVIHGQHFAGFA